MKNSTFMAAASAVGGSIWVGVEGSMLMGFAAVAVYLLLTLAIQLCKGEPPNTLCKFVNNNNYDNPPIQSRQVRAQRTENNTRIKPQVEARHGDLRRNDAQGLQIILHGMQVSVVLNILASFLDFPL
jgi:hypothetical protein